jgi:hypothetical protein
MLLLSACGSSSSDKPKTETDATTPAQQPANQNAASADALTGTWVFEKMVTTAGADDDLNNPLAAENHKNSTGAYFIFNADKTYTIGRKFMGDDLIAGSGTFRVEDNTIYLTDKSGHEAEHEIVQLTADRLTLPFMIYSDHNIVYKKEK